MTVNRSNPSEGSRPSAQSIGDAARPTRAQRFRAQGSATPLPEVFTVLREHQNNVRRQYWLYVYCSRNQKIAMDLPAEIFFGSKNTFVTSEVTEFLV